VIRRTAAAAFLLSLILAPAASARPLRVMSVDQCSDQFVLALAPREEIVGVSPHAFDTDAWLRKQARGLTVRRPTLEEALAAHPDVVVSYWTADGRLTDALQAHGARVVRIEDAHDFEGVRANIRRVATALGRASEGEAMIAHMDAELAQSRGAWGGRSALYLTPGGFTAGPDTLVGAIMAGAGLQDAARAPGYGPISLERLTLNPPKLVVLGFFDDIEGQRWEPGRSPLVARLTKGHTAARLPGAWLGCPAWFAADATAALARAAPGRVTR
jgi:iron complex transport system substrate-binding protein